MINITYQNNDKKLCIFSNMSYDMYYYLVNFQLKWHDRGFVSCLV